MKKLLFASGVAMLLARLLFAFAPHAVLATDACKNYDSCSWWTWLVANSCYYCPDAAGGGSSGAA